MARQNTSHIDDPSALGGRLRATRLDRGLTQSALVFEDSGIAAVATDDAVAFASRPELRCLPLDDEATVLDYVLART